MGVVTCHPLRTYPAGMTAEFRPHPYRFWVLYGLAVLALGGVSFAVTWWMGAPQLALLMGGATVLEGGGFGVIMALVSRRMVRRRARRARRPAALPPLDPDWKTPDFPPPSLRLRDF